MGISAFQQNVLINLEGSEYLLLRKISDTGWQLEDTKTGSYPKSVISVRQAAAAERSSDRWPP
jgi:hypothetical protein